MRAVERLFRRGAADFLQTGEVAANPETAKTL